MICKNLLSPLVTRRSSRRPRISPPKRSHPSLTSFWPHSRTACRAAMHQLCRVYQLGRQLHQQRRRCHQFIETERSSWRAYLHQRGQLSGLYHHSKPAWRVGHGGCNRQRAPNVNLTANGTNNIMAWPAWATDYQLQSNTNLAGANWRAITNFSTLAGYDNVVTNGTTNGMLFYRLKK